MSGVRACPPHLKDRVAALRKRIAGWDTDALLVTNPRDVRYLTDFIGDDSWALVRRYSNRVVVVTDFRFQEQVEREAPHVSVVIRKGPFADVLAKRAPKWGLDGIALQAAYMTLATRKTLGKKLRGLKLVPVDDGLLEQRAVKDEQEIKRIRRAARCQQEAFSVVLKQLKPGQTEQQVAARLEMHMRDLGADGASFDSIVAVGANASLPHAVPGRARVRQGQIVLFDWGARWEGYCSDLTRVVAIGRMPTRIRDIYRIVLEAQLAAIDAIAPGKSVKDVDAVARDIIKKAGHGRRFGHGLGHGIGLDIHEAPTLSYRSEGELRPGHVVTVEPGIYLPGAGGVRIEDDVLVTQRGHRVLSDLPKDLDSAII